MDLRLIEVPHWGVFPTMTVEQALKAVDNLNGTIADGANPAQVKRALKPEPTFAEMIEEFLNKKRNRAGKPLAGSTIISYRGLLNKQLKPLASLKMSKVTPTPSGISTSRAMLRTTAQGRSYPACSLGMKN